MSSPARKLWDIASVLASFDRGQADVLIKVARALYAASDRLDTAKRQQINHDLNHSGMDGNVSFHSVGQGLAAVGAVLSKHGLEWDETLNANTFLRDQGRRPLAIAFSNPQDSFSPTSIANSVVSFAWYKRESGNYEITAYLS